jgi:hypothetical protein
VKWLLYALRRIPGFEIGCKECTLWKNGEMYRAICKQTGSPVESILKNVSTVRCDPMRRKRWGEIAVQAALS